MRGSRLRRHATCVATAGVVALGTATAASAGERADFAIGFGRHAPGTGSTMTLHVRFKAPGDPDGKPPAIRGAVFDAPPGTRFEPSAASACEASDAQLQAQGAPACPESSRLGDGTLTAITGAGAPLDPFAARLDLFRTGDGLIEVVSDPRTGAYLGSDRVTISGSRLTAHPPRTPGGPPDGETTIRQIDWKIDRAGYVVTPPSCPDDGRWVASATFTFDGATETDTSTTPCDRGAAPAAAAPLTVSPARVRAGRRVRFTVRLSASPRCRAGALVRIAGRRARTDRHGRAVLRGRLSRPGRHRALAGRAHCPRRSAVITAT